MARVLALTQFLIIGLGGPVLHLLARIENQKVEPEVLATLAQFLASHVLWLFLIPILYAAIGTAVRGFVSEKVIRVVGIVLCWTLVVLFGGLISLYLF